MYFSAAAFDYFLVSPTARYCVHHDKPFSAVVTYACIGFYLLVVFNSHSTSKPQARWTAVWSQPWAGALDQVEPWTYKMSSPTRKGWNTLSYGAVWSFNRWVAEHVNCCSECVFPPLLCMHILMACCQDPIANCLSVAHAQSTHVCVCSVAIAAAHTCTRKNNSSHSTLDARYLKGAL